MFSRSRTLGLTLAAMLLSATAPAEELPVRKTLSLSAARKIAEAAEAHARENKWNVCIAVVDDGGHLVHFERMDTTQVGSIDVSLKKAQSAARFKRPTKVFEQALADGRTALITLPGAIPIEGGVPILVDGTVIGAVGVSGVTSQQDGMIAQAGIDALLKILEAK